MAWLVDMDGVLAREEHAIAGADRFLRACGSCSSHSWCWPTTRSTHAETCPLACGRMKAGLEAILVLSGVTTRDAADRFPHRASRIVESVADLIDELAP